MQGNRGFGGGEGDGLKDQGSRSTPRERDRQTELTQGSDIQWDGMDGRRRDRDRKRNNPK